MAVINFNRKLAIITALLSGGLVGFGGEQKQDIEIKKSNSDAVKSMQEVYDAFLEDFKTRASELMVEIYDLKATNKELQNQFNDLYIQLEGNRKVFKLGKTTFSIRKKIH
jgi:hypothetical protein